MAQRQQVNWIYATVSMCETGPAYSHITQQYSELFTEMMKP
jgi:hypothetical protein